MRDKIFTYFFSIMFIFLAVLSVLNPETAKNSVISAIFLCGNVIIPSLFPFTACLLFFVNSGFISVFYKTDRITKRLFGLNSYQFCIFLLSLIGGYPIGAKLLNEAVEKRILSPKKASGMLNYCVNAGPAFIIGAVGSGFLGTKKAGYILFACHIISSIFILAFSNKNPQDTTFKTNYKNTADCFVESVTSAAESIINICGYVIFFSVLTSLTEKYLHFVPTYLLEITTAMPKIKNIYLISFLLGFSGICVWCQIFSIAKNIKINILSFALSRILHGFLSSILTFIAIKVLKPALPCITNNINFSQKTFYSGPALSVSLVIMAILLLLSIFKKEYKI